MIALLRWILGWLYTLLMGLNIILVFSLHALVVFLFKGFFKDPEGFAQRANRPFLWCTFNILGSNLSIEGLEHLPPEGQNFILVANHQSHIDVILLVYAIPRKISFIAKKELLDVPILGWDIKQQGHIAIDRGDSRKAVSELKRVESLIEHGQSVILFPEGTRSSDGRLALFKKGAFMMAVNTGIPLLPCRIEGTYNLLNKHSLRMWPSRLVLKIAPAIPVEKISDPGLAKKMGTQLAEEVHGVIESL